VLGVDAAGENIRVARRHAALDVLKRSEVRLSYKNITAGALI
jgi:hypothetical protein